MAIIDILTHYDAKKKAAHAAKTVKHGVSVRLEVVLFLSPCRNAVPCVKRVHLASSF